MTPSDSARSAMPAPRPGSRAPNGSADPLPVFLSPVTWNFPLVGYTRGMTEALWRAGVDALFVQLPSERTALQRLRLAGRTTPGEERVVRPWLAAPKHLWPRVRPERLEGWMRRAARRLRRELDSRLDWERSVALVITPSWAPWLDELPFGRVIYNCIDDFHVHLPLAGLETRFERWERRLIARADGVVSTAQVLIDQVRAARPELPARLIPNGVDERWFQARAAELPEPPELRSIPRPRVVLVGSLAEWIDWPLVRDVIQRLPDRQFVFVGPVIDRAGTQAVRALPNAHFLGARPYRDVPAYIAACERCWAPMRIDEIGRAVNPVKVYEYLALGKPVAATAVAGIDSFEGLVERADDGAAMAAMLSLEPRDDADERRAFAARHSWPQRAASLMDFLRGL